MPSSPIQHRAVGAFRVWLPQTLFAVEAAIDELAKGLGISAYEIRRRNIVKPGDSMLSPPGPAHTDVFYGSYGLDQCLDLVERAMQTEAPKISLSDEWLIGEGIAADHDPTRCRRTAIR